MMARSLRGSVRRPDTEAKTVGSMSLVGPSVWTGRALQAKMIDLGKLVLCFPDDRGRHLTEMFFREIFALMAELRPQSPLCAWRQTTVGGCGTH